MTVNLLWNVSLGASCKYAGMFLKSPLIDSDFLENWELIDRTRLFDESWIMSAHWLTVTVRPRLAAWSYGDVSCEYAVVYSTVNSTLMTTPVTINVPSDTSGPAVIVLSQLDNRYFQDIRNLTGYAVWSFDFVVFRQGGTEPVAISGPSNFHTRSVNLEVELEAGEYVVHVSSMLLLS